MELLPGAESSASWGREMPLPLALPSPKRAPRWNNWRLCLTTGKVKGVRQKKKPQNSPILSSPWGNATCEGKRPGSAPAQGDRVSAPQWALLLPGALILARPGKKATWQRSATSGREEKRENDWEGKKKIKRRVEQYNFVVCAQGKIIRLKSANNPPQSFTTPALLSAITRASLSSRTWVIISPASCLRSPRRTGSCCLLLPRPSASPGAARLMRAAQPTLGQRRAFPSQRGTSAVALQRVIT